MDRGTDDEIRERLRRAGLMDLVEDQEAQIKRDAKILPFKRVQTRKPIAPIKRRIAGALYLLLLVAVTFVSLR